MRFTLSSILLVLAQSSVGSASSAASNKSSATSSKSTAASSVSSTISAGELRDSSVDSAAIALASASLSDSAFGCITATVNVSGCGLPTNFTCVCTNPDFQTRAHSCLTLECVALFLSLFCRSDYHRALRAVQPRRQYLEQAKCDCGKTGGAVALFAANGGQDLIFALFASIKSFGRVDDVGFGFRYDVG
ncbi:hypothetical protein MVEN_02611800 [Mycena venus]|uniref:CFEM domain-containing protein n=1 Tax=Mycena venus TaxID=2733690 RepID=A0A8H6WR60_9AGAR|nr:hypothetical protein MVEN_02611800 [Mycena venus]